MQTVFDKFGGIRPMAAKLAVPSSTVKSWHSKRSIPEWRRPVILSVAAQHGIALDASELEDAAIRAELPTIEGEAA